MDEELHLFLTGYMANIMIVNILSFFKVHGRH